MRIKTSHTSRTVEVTKSQISIQLSLKVHGNSRLKVPPEIHEVLAERTIRNHGLLCSTGKKGRSFLFHSCSTLKLEA